MKSYYIYVNNRQYGPYDESSLRNMNLPPNTPVWCQGMRDWGVLSQVLPSMEPGATRIQQPQQFQQTYQTSQQQAQAYQPTQGAAMTAPEHLSLWGYYKKCLNMYAEFSGRARRSEYWGFTLFNFLITWGLGLVAGLLVVLVLLAMDSSAGSYFIAMMVVYGITILYSLAVLVPSLAVTSRRLHDTGRSLWWILLSLLVIIPIIGVVGPIVLLVFLCLDSEPQRNQYGPNPKTGA